MLSLFFLSYQSLLWIHPQFRPVCCRKISNNLNPAGGVCATNSPSPVALNIPLLALNESCKTSPSNSWVTATLAIMCRLVRNCPKDFHVNFLSLGSWSGWQHGVCHVQLGGVFRFRKPVDHLPDLSQCPFEWSPTVFPSIIASWRVWMKEECSSSFVHHLRFLVLDGLGSFTNLFLFFDVTIFGSLRVHHLKRTVPIANYQQNHFVIRLSFLKVTSSIPVRKMKKSRHCGSIWTTTCGAIRHFSWWRIRAS